MDKLGLDLDDGSSPGDRNKSNPSVARELSVQRCIHSLVHAYQCREANCKLPSCQKMKRVVGHAELCEHKTNGGCPICEQLIALCCYHAKHCQEQKSCPVPFCHNIKQKLQQQQLQQQQQVQHQQPMSGDTALQNQPVAGSQLGKNDQGPLLLHELLQTVREPAAQEQEQRVIQLLRSNPQHMTTFIRLRQQQQQQPHQGVSQQAVSQPGQLVPQQPGQPILPSPPQQIGNAE